MQAGIITEENFSQVLRGISQKRKHGVLELHSGDSVVEISFFQGKIVNLNLDKQPLMQVVVNRLLKRQTIMQACDCANYSTIGQLLDALNARGEDISKELLLLAQQHAALSLLYGLNFGSGSYYHFNVEMIAAPEGEDSLQITVGQLLLDLVSIKESAAIFSKEFPEDTVIERGTRVDREYSLEENDLIWLVDGEMNVSQLKESTLLSQLVFEETLKSLCDEGVLCRAGEGAVSAGDLFDLDALDACIDQLAESESTRTNDIDQQQDTILNSTRVANNTATIRTEKTDNLNKKLLANPMIPDYTVFLFLCLVVLVPLFFW